MNFFLLLGIAVGLSMDSFAVSAAKSAADNFHIWSALKFAVAFSFAHFLMTILGWFGGNSISNFISGVDHWIAFGLLFVIGAKMIYGYFKDGISKEVKTGDLTMKTLFILSVATSIDALVIGISFAFLDVNIWNAALIIAVTIFVMTLFGVVAGKNFNKILGHKSELVGGLVLIAIGSKTLIEHLHNLI